MCTIAYPDSSAQGFDITLDNPQAQALVPYPQCRVCHGNAGGIVAETRAAREDVWQLRRQNTWPLIAYGETGHAILQA